MSYTKHFGMHAAICCMACACGAAFAVELSEPPARQVENLNPGWEFTKDPQVDAPGDSTRDAGWSPVNLPHTWNNRDGQDGGNDYHRGPARYRRQLNVPGSLRGRRIFLRFGAANTVADVYINDRHVSQHRGGFAAFCFEITDHVRFGHENRLLVTVDNSHFDDVAPWSADFTFFGGLYRDVELLALHPICITPLDHASPGVFLHQRNVGAERAEVHLLAKISNGTSETRDVTVVATARDHRGHAVARTESPTVIAAAAVTPVELELRVDHPRLWNGRVDPYMYEVEVALLLDGRVIDRVQQPLGLRAFEVDAERGLLLNGKPLDVHGVNRHQDWLDMGWAIGRAEHDRDMALIREMGCTAVRLAHYQHDDYVYSLCDRSGLVVWAEIPLVNRVVDSAAFRANCRQQLLELIRQNFNHPSIFFWGIHNEVTAPWAPGPDPTELVQELARLARTEDPSRLTVCAATTPDDHPANWQTDLVAFNRYFGWYHGQPDEFAAWADRIHNQHPDKPLGISEYGAGASIQHHEHPVRMPRHDGEWHPEEWQAHVHERHWLAMHRRPYLWCKFVWNMFDFASDGRSEGDTPGRNDKGLVTYDRGTKKDAFYWYKANWSDEPFVHIAGRRHVQRNASETDVRVYSNRDEVTLYVNGASLGTKRADSGVIFTWSDVTLEPGTNIIRAESGIGADRVIDMCQWVVCPQPKPEAEPDLDTP